MRYEINKEMKQAIDDFYKKMKEMGVVSPEISTSLSYDNIYTLAERYPDIYANLECKIEFVIPEKYIDVIKED